MRDNRFGLPGDSGQTYRRERIHTMILIQNGLIVDPKAKKQYVADILLYEGRIRCIGEHLAESLRSGVCESGQTEITVIDATGKTILPGLIDVHTHFRDPGFTYKEDIETGSRAAAKGGYTTVVMMANTKPSIDNADTLHYVLEKGASTDIRVESCAAISTGLKGQELVLMEKLRAEGAAGFTDDGIPLMDAELLREACRRTAAMKVPISLHEEDPSLITNNGVNRGRASEYYGIGGSPAEAETSLVARDIRIAAETGAILNIQHVSAGATVELIREAKKTNPHLHAEACPHHFTLTEEDVIRYGTLAKMNPPLRTEADRQSVIAGILDGTLDLIATDHAPHSTEEKQRPITEAPSGIIGLETALSLAFGELVCKAGMSRIALAERMSYTPARMYGFACRGYVQEGALADLVIFDEKSTWIAGNYVSKAENSPYTGQKMQGCIEYTICDGKIVYCRQNAR